jgi:anti-sigma B factor antagonist
MHRIEAQHHYDGVSVAHVQTVASRDASESNPARRRQTLMDQPSSHLKMRREGEVAVVEFSDRKILEELSIQEIGDDLQRLAESEPRIKLLLNFDNVEHLSSAALGMLITLNKKVGEQDGELKLSNINRQIFEVFKITRLNRVFDIYDNERDALQAMGAV